MKQNIESVVECLKECIDKNGLSYLSENPYDVYTFLVESGVDKKTAAALLHFMVSGCFEDAKRTDVSNLSCIIRRECSLNKKMADILADILTSLFSLDNMKEWGSKEFSGLKKFLEEDFTCSWEGFAVWDAGNGTVDCHYKADIVLKPTQKLSSDKELSVLLEKNPFLTKEAIHELFLNRLQSYLDYDFEDYCTCDDYYQPVVEDYGSNLKSNLSGWCKENGFEFLSCSGYGEDDGYEPKFRRC